jgi:hypothetical protein
MLFHASASAIFATPLDAGFNRQMEFTCFELNGLPFVQSHLYAFLAYKDANNYLGLKISSNGLLDLGYRSAGVWYSLGTFTQPVHLAPVQFIIQQQGGSIFVYNLTTEDVVFALVIAGTGALMDPTWDKQGFFVDALTTSQFQIDNFLAKILDPGKRKGKMGDELCRSRIIY